MNDAAQQDIEYMELALAEARKAYALGEAPVGAIIVRNNDIIASAFNTREQSEDPTGHAEIQAIRQASKVLRAWRLIDCTMYVTLEPCPMCAGALWSSRIQRVVFGASDPKAGALTSLFNIGSDQRLNHRFAITGGVLAEECGGILTEFFQQRRAKNLSV